MDSCIVTTKATKSTAKAVKYPALSASLQDAVHVYTRELLCCSSVHSMKELFKMRDLQLIMLVPQGWSLVKRACTSTMFPICSCATPSGRVTRL